MSHLGEEMESFSFSEAEMAIIAGVPEHDLNDLRKAGWVKLSEPPTNDAPYHFALIYAIYNNLPDSPHAVPGGGKVRELPPAWLDRAEEIMSTKVGSAKATKFRHDYEQAIKGLVDAGQIDAYRP